MPTNNYITNSYMLCQTAVSETAAFGEIAAATAACLAAAAPLALPSLPYNLLHKLCNENGPSSANILL